MSTGSWEDSVEKLRDGAPGDFNLFWDQEDEEEPVQGTKKEQPVRWEERVEAREESVSRNK